jgi:hypothetical protein
MILEPRKWTVTVEVTPGQLLGLTLCQVSNNVNEIYPGLIDNLNKASPGSVEVGDRITAVNGEEGAAFLLIRQFVGSLSGGSGTLCLTILRPVEFDVAIHLTDGKELGLSIMDIGFVQDVARDGMVASHNAKQRSLEEPCLLVGDRVIEISGREPSTEDGAAGNVLPYLRLAMCGGASPLLLRVRRGEYVPAPADNSKRVENVAAPKVPASQKYANCFRLQNVFKTASATSKTSSRTLPERLQERSAQVLRNFGLTSRKPQQPTSVKVVKMDSKVSVEEPSTPSTRGPSSASSASDQGFEDSLRMAAPAMPALILPGIVRRTV